MKYIYFVTYNQYSKSAKALQEKFKETPNWRTYKYSKSSFNYSPFMPNGAIKKALLVYWGTSGHASSALAHQREINEASTNRALNMYTYTMTNKRGFLQSIQQDDSVPIIPFTTSQDRAINWMSEGKAIVARTKLDSHSAEGLHIIKTANDWVNAPLYTLYKKKAEEYRLHIFKFSPDIIIQQKRLRQGTERTDKTFEVRNVHNGWVYCRENVNCPQAVIDAAKRLRESQYFTLDFGAVDIIYNKAEDKAYILEVNTAPGLAGTTVSDYFNVFSKYYDDNIGG